MTSQVKQTKSVEGLMSEALLRSGYTLESRIIRKLVQNNYFVEPNQRVLDPKTGKSREIDVIAELFEHNPALSPLEPRVYVSTYFVCEAKNNPYPVVLLTELPFSPSLDVWESTHEHKTGFFADNFLDPSFYDFLTEEYRVYTQYCSFRQKKGNNSEWVALHPDDFYDDLEKIISWSMIEAKPVSPLEDNVHRLLLHLPVVILGGDLYVAHPTQDIVALEKVDAALYMHFNIEEEQRSSSIVVFVTEKYFLELFERILQFGRSVEDTIRTQLSSGKSSPQ